MNLVALQPLAAERSGRKPSTGGRGRAEGGTQHRPQPTTPSSGRPYWGVDTCAAFTLMGRGLGSLDGAFDCK